MSFQGSISNIAKRLQGESSSVWEVHDKACAMAARGEDVILLSVGDPDLDTHPDTVDYAIQQLKKGRTHYAPGMGELSLREVIADIESRTSKRQCGPENILICPGATNAIYTVMSCLLNVGDEVVVADPMYVGYFGIFDSVGSHVIRVPLQTNNNFELDVDLLTAAVTDKTRVIFINTPGNPAGNMIKPAQLRQLAEYCYQKNIWLVSDEVYSMITFEEKHTSLLAAAEHLDNIIVIDGLSKSHSMTGWRLGWIVASVALQKELLNFASATIFGCCQFVQDAGAFALKNDAAYMAEIRQAYKIRRDYAAERIATIDGLHCQPPKAGMFMMVDVSAVAADGEAFAKGLLKQEKVSVLPGSGFGESTRDYVRVSLTLPTESLGQAFDRIERYVKKLTGA
ncbi:pyridoxal phosphate-dependent aminotransferase [Aestuariicella hydrocarbonica]|uniref:Aminotransferase n=1 Tax=Pseudomaricurvus hydrocarbonicus TaxID=1470433 RepID=A0A9E5JS69_9GAMM|nr:pyridoxal phosphate-dependent aminotransferase [Aestuariicella hydrocarbonica]NHO65847.1 pyridoxal phosphate-dependent aminotransferase [Aestuariicella hydrocarbonica]